MTAEYSESIMKGISECFSIAARARSLGYDPEDKVEIEVAKDMAGRVEAIVGPKGVAARIRELEAQGLGREEIAFKLAEMICSGEFGDFSQQQKVEMAVRTGTAVITEGVVVAPTEGIVEVKIEEWKGSNYVSIYYAGPIRGAGGTAVAMTVLLADYARQKLGIGRYSPMENEIERYVEEVNLYDARAAKLQYKPSDDDIRHIFRNCPICINGHPTEDFEVSAYRNLERVNTNKVRGGVALVSCEGIAQKAMKVLKYARKFNLDWEWLEKVIKVVTSKESKTEIKPSFKYLEGLVAGRPIFSYPMASGGFRLRYGRARTTGIMAKAIHPATMVILDDFIAHGTQMKVERPGKSSTITSCTSIEGPLVMLNDGSVERLNSLERAMEVKGKVEKVYYLGDILITYGDFQKSGHPLVPAGYCEEWWSAECKEKGGAKSIGSCEDAFEFSKIYNVPLHPKYLLFWNQVSKDELIALIDSLVGAPQKGDVLILNSALSDTLAKLGCEFKKVDGQLYIKEDYSCALLYTLGMLRKSKEEAEKAKEAISSMDIFQALSFLSGVEIRDRAGTFIGARMGRPEKAEPRMMNGKPHVLYPTGVTRRNLNLVYEGKSGYESSVEIAIYYCSRCNTSQPYKLCGLCGSRAERMYICQVCNKKVRSSAHCGKECSPWIRKVVGFKELFEAASKRLGYSPKALIGVQGLIGKEKEAERIEKGFLREKYGIYVNKDGTARYDMINAPLTQFMPAEIGTPVEKLKELGYSKDIYNEELSFDTQMLPLKVQDVIIPEKAGEYFVRVSQFIDELLVYLYKEKPFYNLKKKEDLVGHLVLGLSPHTSAAVVGRVIGFTKADVQFCHPYFHTAKRRNCDGDEDSIMLLLDALLNFSKHFLGRSRGGTMDAPIVLTTIIDPEEVDDEVYAMEIVPEYGAEFYRAASELKSPSEVKVRTVKDIIGKEEQYGPLDYTHHTATIDAGPVRSTYKLFNSVPEKIDEEMRIHSKLRAVDFQDAAERVITSHFLPDLYGNLRKFSRQGFRCVKCNAIYRRVPLVGKCTRCGGSIALTVSKGGVLKFLEIASEMVDKYSLSPYLKERLELFKAATESIFGQEKRKQKGITEFM
ncbi:MAG: DNA polymerase II large subunit [Candidatus Anstonellales archaeon]